MTALDKLIRKYEDGYRRKPEKLSHVRNIEKAGLEALLSPAEMEQINSAIRFALSL